MVIVFIITKSTLNGVTNDELERRTSGSIELDVVLINATVYTKQLGCSIN